MNVRSRKNKNLKLTTKSTFLGRPIQTTHGPLCIDYLEKIHDTIERALDDYPRLMALRVDLKFPQLREREDLGYLMTDFIRSLQSQIDHSGRKRKREGGRVHPCKVRSIWVKERSTSINDHYHLVLLFNKDRFNWLGKTLSHPENLGGFIVEAWARVVGVDYDEANGLVYFSKDKRKDSVVIHRLNRHSSDFDDSFDELFKHASYLAKEDTKHFGNRKRNFGCSRR
ncbi:inovirus Gp2 family protein [Vibrio fluvialis]|uniref:Inovirus Gp2 family protein n=1 Tax=Vibrio fluvialis TaxID=676 RepID=A0AAX2LSX4_VIBFL|nr:inovirus Gp2 family protein [Vibrio fluvialis]AMF95117.1 inovirus Gp2 family protein [Vibrio fluvialis]EKO4010439.1 inovirus Gp2 family protein [Vibrio fluvialis]MBY7936198.1 inovirus Gp2 family protein [Vibrio fluvialis]MBY8216319.1 inovirus Gp2 family protein [Vibrio fluvialis]MBY8229025.1 inovirus Gp2 family protein [Vibrio fluvialis]